GRSAGRIRPAQEAPAGPLHRRQLHLLLPLADVLLVPEDGRGAEARRAGGGGDADDDRRRHVRPHLRQIPAAQNHAAAAQRAEDLPYPESERRAGDADVRPASLVRSGDLQMTAERRLPVMFVVAATLVTVTTLVLGAVGAANLITRSRDEQARLRRVSAAQANELAVALALPVWNIDRAQIDKILDSQAGAMTVEAVVVNAAGYRHARIRDARRNLVTTNGVVRTEGLLVERMPIVFGGETIGSMVLCTTPRFARETLRQSLITTLLTILITDIILVLSIYLVLYRTVLRPLVEIERFAGAVSVGGAGSVPPAEAAGTKELEQLRSSIDTMVRTIKDEQDFTEKALNVVNEIFFIQDREGHFVRWNRATADVFGVDALQREARYILHTQTHPDDRHLVLEAIEEIFGGGGFAEI